MYTYLYTNGPLCLLATFNVMQWAFMNSSRSPVTVLYNDTGMVYGKVLPRGSGIIYTIAPITVMPTWHCNDVM